VKRLVGASIGSRVSVAASLAALAFGGFCLTAALAAQGGRFSPRLDLLADVAPLWLLGALGITAYGLLLAPHCLRLAVGGIGAAGVVASMALIIPEFTRPIRAEVPADGDRQIKLIEFNAHIYKVADVRSAADWLVRQSPDFILLEDARAPIRQTLVSRGYNFTHGIADTAIFSRSTPAGSPFFIEDQVWPRLPDFARATFDSPAGRFSLVAVHLAHPTDRSQLQAALALASVLDRYDHSRLIVAGDFNLAPWSFGLRTLDKRFGLERRDRALFSWPAYRSRIPIVPLDHVYAGQSWRTVSIQRGPGLGSDHYPVVATLVLKK
jgi:endonuclease/exonuclease/phosphatase (EEP) superfamily protein YafD